MEEELIMQIKNKNFAILELSTYNHQREDKNDLVGEMGRFFQQNIYFE